MIVYFTIFDDFCSQFFFSTGAQSLKVKIPKFKRSIVKKKLSHRRLIYFSIYCDVLLIINQTWPSRPSAHRSLPHGTQTLHSYKSANKNVIICLCSCVFLGRFGSNLRQSEDSFSVSVPILVPHLARHELNAQVSITFYLCRARRTKTW